MPKVPKRLEQPSKIIVQSTVVSTPPPMVIEVGGIVVEARTYGLAADHYATSCPHCGHGIMISPTSRPTVCLRCAAVINFDGVVEPLVEPAPRVVLRPQPSAKRPEHGKPIDNDACVIDVPIPGTAAELIDILAPRLPEISEPIPTAADADPFRNPVAAGLVDLIPLDQ